MNSVALLVHSTMTTLAGCGEGEVTCISALRSFMLIASCCRLFSRPKTSSAAPLSVSLRRLISSRMTSFDTISSSFFWDSRLVLCKLPTKQCLSSLSEFQPGLYGMAACHVLRTIFILWLLSEWKSGEARRTNYARYAGSVDIIGRRSYRWIFCLHMKLMVNVLESVLHVFLT